jgi:phosphopantothenoylcysteine decarboxylase/phosphopantothenate--cysteine ligase
MAEPLRGKTVVVGITGSIAAYKGAELVRELLRLGADVHATLTRAGAKFITPLTLRSLTKHPVTVDMFDEPEQWEIHHVALAQQASVVVVAPATADAIAKLAVGIADEFLYSLALATRAPLVVAPAMDASMYEHAATQENLARLRARGVVVVEPEEGPLASGLVGRGRLAAPQEIAAVVVSLLLGAQPSRLPRAGPAPALRAGLEGVRVLVTAGPTREPLDPVRFISNRSSGKMGYALAAAAARRGAQVSLVSGPTSLAAPAGCELVSVTTAAEMQQAVLARFPHSQVLIAAAAVADYAPARVATSKLKRKGEALTLELKPTADILAECGRRRKRGQVLVGFAAETGNVLANARKKLVDKRLDIIVANDVSAPGIGFDSDRNAGHLLSADGQQVELPEMEKQVFAERVIDAVAGALRVAAAGGSRRAAVRRAKL